jgi:hypothetical protein
MGQTEISGRCYVRNRELDVVDFGCAKSRRVGILHNLSDMRRTPSAGFGLHLDRVPVAYQRSRHVRPDDETTPGEWSMDTDVYSDNSYNYSITSTPRPSPTDWNDQMTHDIDYRAKTSTDYNNISTHCPVSQLPRQYTTNLPLSPLTWNAQTAYTDKSDMDIITSNWQIINNK